MMFDTPFHLDSKYFPLCFELSKKETRKEHFMTFKNFQVFKNSFSLTLHPSVLFILWKSSKLVMDDARVHQPSWMASWWANESEPSQGCREPGQAPGKNLTRRAKNGGSSIECRESWSEVPYPRREGAGPSLLAFCPVWNAVVKRTMPEWVASSNNRCWQTLAGGQVFSQGPHCMPSEPKVNGSG